jgi:hypothetical protein
MKSKDQMNSRISATDSAFNALRGELQSLQSDLTSKPQKDRVAKIIDQANTWHKQ